MDLLKQRLHEDPLIHSIANDEEFDHFLEHSAHQWGCLKNSSINSLEGMLDTVHRSGKKILLHLDSTKGIGKDKEGIEYLQAIGVEAIIAMKSQNIRPIREMGIPAILGSFLVDSSAVTQTLKNVQACSPDAILIMPMSVPEAVYAQLKKTGLCLLAGGMGTSHDVIQNAFDYGADGCIITNKQRLRETYRLRQK